MVDSTLQFRGLLIQEGQSLGESLLTLLEGIAQVGLAEALQDGSSLLRIAPLEADLQNPVVIGAEPPFDGGFQGGHR